MADTLGDAEVTAAMKEAGARALTGFDPGYGNSWDMAEEVYRVMAAARRQEERDAERLFPEIVARTIAGRAGKVADNVCADREHPRTAGHARIDKLEQTIADAAQPRPVAAGHVCTRFRAKWGAGVECMDCGKGAVDG